MERILEGHCIAPGRGSRARGGSSEFFSILLKAWLSLVPVGGLFVRVGDPEDRCLVQMFPDDLEADRETLGVEPARKRESGEAGEIDGDREDV